jgi:DNA-binding IclR family transcriptional regulator
MRVGNVGQHFSNAVIERRAAILTLLGDGTPRTARQVADLTGEGKDAVAAALSTLVSCGSVERIRARYPGQARWQYRRQLPVAS